MKYSLNGKQLLLLFADIISHKSIAGLVGHIKTHFPTMYRLYIILKDRTEPPTDDELAIASAEKVVGNQRIVTHGLSRLHNIPTNI